MACVSANEQSSSRDMPRRLRPAAMERGMPGAPVRAVCVVG